MSSFYRPGIVAHFGFFGSVTTRTASNPDRFPGRSDALQCRRKHPQEGIKLSDAASHKKMIQAAKAGDIATVRALLEADPSLAETRDTDASTPLHCAAWKGHAEIAALLLDVGADIHARNRNEHWGDTPLHAAAHGNQRAVAALLIERGADIGARNAAGRTPLRETEFHNASSVARLLRERGAVS